MAGHHDGFFVGQANRVAGLQSSGGGIDTDSSRHRVQDEIDVVKLRHINSIQPGSTFEAGS